MVKIKEINENFCITDAHKKEKNAMVFPNVSKH